MMIKKLALAIIGLLYLSSTALAGTDKSAGTTASAFLNLEQGGRASGMGGAFVSLADDSTAPYWNPAGVNQIRGKSLGVAHTLWLEDISATYLGYVQSLGDKAGFGLGLIGFSSGDMERWTGYGSSDGTFGAFGGSIILSYAREMLSGLSLGTGVKLIREGIDDESENHFVLDAGGRYNLPGRNLRVGVVIQNLGPKASLAEEDFCLPFTVRLGASSGLLAQRLILAADIHKIKGQRAGFNFGLEYWAIPGLALRAGYNLKGESTEVESLSGFSLGLGFRIKNYQLDYAYSAGDRLDGVHKFSFGLDLKPSRPSFKFRKAKPEKSGREKPAGIERKPVAKEIEDEHIEPRPARQAGSAPEKLIPEEKRKVKPESSIKEDQAVGYEHIEPNRAGEKLISEEKQKAKPKSSIKEDRAVGYEYIEPKRKGEKLIPEDRQKSKPESFLIELTPEEEGTLEKLYREKEKQGAKKEESLIEKEDLLQLTPEEEKELRKRFYGQ
ncbi:MAG: PorV/PorQ family protein [bacterium]|nr:PorV/PorQ family protein [bacterium]